MNRRLFWKLCLVIGTGVVALFYAINITVSQIENDMSSISEDYRTELNVWREQAQKLFENGDLTELNNWLEQLQLRENTWAAVATASVEHIAGNTQKVERYIGYNMGRSIEWQIHLYFEENPILELPFTGSTTSLLIQLPARMRPGSLWTLTRIGLQVFFPMLILIALSVILYRHIMNPLKQLESATRAFSKGDFEVRVRDQLGKRDDELAQLSDTFDRMADHIGDLIVRQRQLITDLSHELRTPLTRLDIATENLICSDKKNIDLLNEKLSRVHRESKHIRKLVDDTLTLSWLENESPELRNESLDLVDLIEVLIEDANFEFPDRKINVDLLDSAFVENSNHRALGQAIENILRNALRYTPRGKTVTVALNKSALNYEVDISDEGPGVPEHYLDAIFRPFFRVDSARHSETSSFGLGLALARRQLAAVAAGVRAKNIKDGGLTMSLSIPAC